MSSRKYLFVVPLVALLSPGCSESTPPPSGPTATEPAPADAAKASPGPALGPEGIVD